MLQSSSLDLFVYHSVTTSVSQSLTIFCPLYVFQNDVYRTCFTKYKFFVLILYHFYLFNIIMVKFFPFYLWQFKLKASLLWTVCPCYNVNSYAFCPRIEVICAIYFFLGAKLLYEIGSNKQTANSFI